MTEAEKLAYIRSVGNYDDNNPSDEVLSAFLLKAKDIVLATAYPYGYDEEQEMPGKYDIVQCDIAIYHINKRGAEGETRHDENGVSRMYGSADTPSDLLARITPHCASIRSSNT